MEDILWIEDVVESTPTPLFLTNFIVDTASFVDPCKVVVRRNAFLIFSSARNGVESKGGTKSERFKIKVKGDLNLQNIPKSIPIPNKKTPKKNDCDRK